LIFGVSGVFISYARADTELAWRIVRGLRALDVHVWWDQEMTSVDWHYELANRINELAAVVVLWTPRSCNSDAVRDEARLAGKKDKLVNLLFELPEPPYPFERLTGLSIEDWHGPSSNAIWARIVKSIDAHLAKAGAIKAGTLAARQAAQYAEFTAKERSLAGIETALKSAEAKAKRAVMAIESVGASLADLDADLANVKASKLSKSVMAAAEAAARSERDAAEAALTRARAEADSAMAAATTAAARRDAANADFQRWQIERGAVDPDGTMASPGPSEPKQRRLSIVPMAIVVATAAVVALGIWQWPFSGKENPGNAIDGPGASNISVNSGTATANTAEPRRLAAPSWLTGTVWGANGDCSTPVRIIDLGAGKLRQDVGSDSRDAETITSVSEQRVETDKGVFTLQGSAVAGTREVMVSRKAEEGYGLTSCKPR
jgi:hypothetical protein